MSSSHTSAAPRKQRVRERAPSSSAEEGLEKIVLDMDVVAALQYGTLRMRRSNTFGTGAVVSTGDFQSVEACQSRTTPHTVEGCSKEPVSKNTALAVIESAWCTSGVTTVNPWFNVNTRRV